jgi:DNA-binding beta-propeller fold protein YncE
MKKCPEACGYCGLKQGEMFMNIRKTATVVALLLGAATVSVYAQEAGINPARGAALARQLDMEKSYTQLSVDDRYLQLAIPGQTMGETMGVDENSKHHLFVYTRTENQGIARGGKAAKLFEFDPSYKFVKEWGPNNYAESFAHSVRVDKNDNVYQVDEGSGMIIKYNPQGQHVFWLGRTPEAIDYLEANLEILHYNRPNAPATPPKPVGRVGAFDRETAIAFDKAGNMFVSDGYGNSRFVKISPDGHWLKAVGTNGSGPLQFNTPHDIAVDAEDNVYVADRGNNRIQVFDDNMNHQRDITGIGAPWALCISNSSPQVMYSGDGTGKVYRMSMDGKVTGMFITGQDHGTEDTGNLIHSLSCHAPNTVFIGSASMWDIQKVTVK